MIFFAGKNLQFWDIPPWSCKVMLQDHVAANSIWKVEAAFFWVLPGIFLPLLKGRQWGRMFFFVCFLECLLPLAQSTATAAGESFGLKKFERTSPICKKFLTSRWGFETVFENLTFVTAWKSCLYFRFKPALFSRICRRGCFIMISMLHWSRGNPSSPWVHHVWKSAILFLGDETWFLMLFPTISEWCWYVTKKKACEDQNTMGFPVGVFFPPLKYHQSSCLVPFVGCSTGHSNKNHHHTIDLETPVTSWDTVYKTCRNGEILHPNCFAGFLVLSTGSKANSKKKTSPTINQMTYNSRSQQCWLCLFFFPVRPQAVLPPVKPDTGGPNGGGPWGWPSRLAKTSEKQVWLFGCNLQKPVKPQRHLSKGNFPTRAYPLLHDSNLALLLKRWITLPFCAEHLGRMFCKPLMLMVWAFFSWILGLVTVFFVSFEFGSISWFWINSL